MLEEGIIVRRETKVKMFKSSIFGIRQITLPLLLQTLWHIQINMKGLTRFLAISESYSSSIQPKGLFHSIKFV